MTTNNPNIIGIFVSLNCRPYRVVIRRKVDVLRYRYDLYTPWYKIEALVEVLQVLSNEVQHFTQKLLEVDNKHYRQNSRRKRHYIHTEKGMLYGDMRNDLAIRYSRKVSELWLGSNINTAQILQVIREACEAAEIDYGAINDLKF